MRQFLNSNLYRLFQGGVHLERLYAREDFGQFTVFAIRQVSKVSQATLQAQSSENKIFRYCK